MQIRDPIHGYIRLNELEEQLLDTPEMQRLRRIRQLGFTNLVYPSATHTRFEHSLGALSLADDFGRSLDVDGETRQELRVAALLHDIGHGPFSHVTERLFREDDVRHEEFSVQKVQEEPVVGILEEEGIEPERICQLIDGEGTLGSVIAGHIDVDRMDYLMRDAHYTGTAYGTIDASTIIRAAAVENGRLVFDAQYVNALESLLTARYLMIPTVYMHRTCRIAQSMFVAACRAFLAAGDLPVSRLAAMDDAELLSRLRESPAAAEMVERMDGRELYKVAARLPPDADTAAVKEQVRSSTGLGEMEVLLDRIDTGRSEPADVPVVAGGETATLSDVSPLPAALEDALDRHREVRVYAPREKVDAVASAVEENR